MMEKSSSLHKLHAASRSASQQREKHTTTTSDAEQAKEARQAAQDETVWPPPLVPLFIQRLAVGEDYTCFINAQGKVISWGSNKLGQLGIGLKEEEESIQSINSPRHRLTFPAPAVSIAGGQKHCLVLLADGQVFYWGSNQYGQLAPTKYPEFRSPRGPVPIRIPYPKGFNPLTPNPKDPSLLLGYPPQKLPPAVFPIPPSLKPIPTPPPSPPPPDVKDPNAPPPPKPPPPKPPLPPIARTASIAAGEAHSCLIREDGKLYCWGENDFGRIGLNHTTTTHRPTDPVDLPHKVIQAAAGQAHTAALLVNGSVFCWGFNGDGQLGLGNTKNTSKPTQAVSLPAPATMISCGFSHNAALLEDGRVFCWGWNYHGRLGLGHEDNLLKPSQPVELPDKAVAISAGWDFTAALLENGHIFCWGDNRYGQLGIGTQRPVEGFLRDKYGYYCVQPTRPVQLSAQAVAVAVGVRHAAALLENGHIFCWGDNRCGQLGSGDNQDTLGPSKPVQLQS